MLYIYIILYLKKNFKYLKIGVFSAVHSGEQWDSEGKGQFSITTNVSLSNTSFSSHAFSSIQSFFFIQII